MSRTNPFASSRGALSGSTSYANRTRPTSISGSMDSRLVDFTNQNADPLPDDFFGDDEEIDALLQEQLASLSPLQRLLDRTGLTNFAGNITANYKTAMDERAYNSIQAQTERMRQAGLNADLLGTQGSEDDSAGTMAEGLATVASGAFLKSFGDSIMSFCTGVVGIANSFIDMRGKSMANELNALSAISEGSNIGDSMIDALAGDMLNLGDPALATIQTEEDLKALSDNLLKEITKSGSTDYFKKYVKSPRLRKLLNKGLNERLRSAKGKSDFYSAIKNTYESYYGARLSQSMVQATENDIFDSKGESIGKFFDNIGHILIESDYFKHLNESQYERASDPNLQAGAENASNRYNRDFYNTADGVTAGTASNSAYSNQDVQQQYQKDINDVKKALMDYAKSLRDDPKSNAFERGLGSILPLLLPALLGDMQMNIPQLPTVNHKQSTTVYNNDTKNFNENTYNTVNN